VRVLPLPYRCAMKFTNGCQGESLESPDELGAYVAERKHVAGFDDMTPRGVRILHENGSVSECSVIRDPEADKDGNAQWAAVPPPGVTFRKGDSLAVAAMPPHATISLSTEMTDS
jgi:hypothetical protein